MISYDCLLAGGTIRRVGVAKHCRAGKFKQRTRENEKRAGVLQPGGERCGKVVERRPSQVVH